MLTNLIYLKVSPVDHFSVTWGISAGDYINGISKVPQNIIMINDDVDNSNSFNVHSKFPTITGQSQVRDYVIRGHKTGVLPKWMDYQTKDGLDSLSDDEIADLLYLAHMDVPRRRNPFSVKLDNEFVYLGGTNGFNRFYFRNFTELDHILELSIKRHLRHQRNNKRIFARPIQMKDIDQDILSDLLHFSVQGMIIAFELGKETQRQFKMPLFKVDKSQTKVVWGSEGQLLSNAEQVGTLTYNTLSNKWSIDLKVNREQDLNDL
ncbi:hypothetical protein ACQW5G_05830 [Fructilactobacillus sp. Tb1]|uniref:hypothetical protein n=1 Tax=Fructilactobacillus sp. Tb1 TaxID=3422304 RepID=UPI003D2C41DE